MDECWALQMGINITSAAAGFENATVQLTAAVLLEENSEQTCTNTSMHWPGYLCPADMMCLKGENPNYGRALPLVHLFST